jgi:hypothetical protein
MTPFDRQGVLGTTPNFDENGAPNATGHGKNGVESNCTYQPSE